MKQLTQREVSTAIRLLGSLQGHPESAIESSLPPGKNAKPMTDFERRNIKLDRRDWRLAENLIKKLSAREARTA